MRKLILSLVCLISVIALVGFAGAPGDGSAKDFSLKDLGGRQISLDSFKGHVVVLAFFTTWCPSCQDEMPQLATLHNKYQSREFEVVGINIKESKESVALFAKEKKLPFTILLDEKGDVASKYQVRYIPRIFILDKSGKVVFKAQYMPLEQIEKELIKVLK